jgi:hypothetical protein
MDNHAGNFNTKELKWLGGLIDSDGCVSISSSLRKNNKVVYTPNITVTNNNLNIVDKCIDVLSNHNINHHVKPNGLCKNITISRPTIISNFCRLMEDYILTKRQEFKLISHYCKCRIKNVETHGCNWKARYTEEEIKLVEELKYLNINHYKECLEYGISETIPNLKVLELFSLEWLAGFIDGDGCVTINKIKRANGSYQYQPMVHIVTGSPLSKSIISTYLDRYNINYYLKKQLPGVKHKPNCKNKKFEFYIRSMRDCINILHLVSDNLYGKKNRALKLSDFCYSRLSRINKSYNAYEIALHDWIKKDIKDSSTTKSKTSFDEDIV